MELIKKGSKGDDVRKIQDYLLSQYFYTDKIDGDFGTMTEEAVRRFQMVARLDVDGIVGPKTWKAMFGEEHYDDIEIAKGYINTHISHLPNRQIKYIAIHYTAGSSSKAGSAMAVRRVFLKRNASADFVVDDGTIVQINPDLKNCYCWSVGDKKNPYGGGGQLYGKATNRNTISIEICSNLRPGTSASAANHSGWYFTEASLKNALKLVRYLMKKFNVPIENVVRHYDISGKMCPGIEGWNTAPMYDTDGNKTGRKNDSREWGRFHDSI